MLARLDAMQLRLDDALARQASAHAQNRRKVTVIAAVVLICCSAGAGALAVRNHAARKAQAAYAAQPEWVRLRDSYADAAGDDEYGQRPVDRRRACHARRRAGRCGRGFFSSPIARARSGMPIAPC